MQRFNENYLNKIKSSVDINLSKYALNVPPIENFSKQFVKESQGFYSNIKLEVQHSNNEKLDYKNSEIIYSGLSHLTLSEVSDEKMWAFMTHVTHWDYMRKRWPIENTVGDERSFILNRYFFKQRPHSRNGLARLWWFGYITYNEKFDDKFYLTKLMLLDEDQDIARMILETPTISRNKKMVEATLISLNELKENYRIKSRDYIRYAARYINLTGSVTLWDYLDEDDLREIINNMKINWENSQYQQITMKF